MVWASSSSVYGDAEAHPCREATTPTLPRSPYGVTKRACEDLARVYRSPALAIIGLRYFTVYGPRQRPDMAIRRICDALASGGTFPLYGDGSQSRDFTYVADAVDATVRCAHADVTGADVYNIGGGEEATLAQVIATLEALAGARLRARPAPESARRRAAYLGRRRRSPGATSAGRPTVPLEQGLAAELAWVRARERDRGRSSHDDAGSRW